MYGVILGFFRLHVGACMTSFGHIWRVDGVCVYGVILGFLRVHVGACMTSFGHIWRVDGACMTSS